MLMLRSVYTIGSGYLSNVILMRIKVDCVKKYLSKSDSEKVNKANE